MIAPSGFLATPVGEHLSELVRGDFVRAGIDGPDAPAGRLADGFEAERCILAGLDSGAGGR